MPKASITLTRAVAPPTPDDGSVFAAGLRHRAALSRSDQADKMCIKARGSAGYDPARAAHDLAVDEVELSRRAILERVPETAKDIAAWAAAAHQIIWRAIDNLRPDDDDLLLMRAALARLALSVSPEIQTSLIGADRIEPLRCHAAGDVWPGRA